MIVEIRKAGFVNKGAELMLRAVMQKTKDRYPEATLVMAPSAVGGRRHFSKLVAHGFMPKAWLWAYGVQWGNLASYLPARLRQMYGLVLDKEIDVVIDVAGFSYSDQWGTGSSEELARSSIRWRRNGTKVILMPQALGPYKHPANQKSVKEWVKNTDLIFAREEDSYKYLTEIVGKQEKIKICPDFTNLIEGTLPPNYDPSNKRIALVPNYRMIDKTSKQESDAYLPFMIKCAQYLVNHGAKPFILIHEGANDQMLADKISDAAGGIPIIKETDPLHIKGILGTCDATIGSRFHGLVSALSQGVPSLATGWSHKYIRLFEDYKLNDGIVTVMDSDDAIYKKINNLLNPAARHNIKLNLLEWSSVLKKKSLEMWDFVFEIIDQVQKESSIKTNR
jgi:colanic acid/amylovoran biosynthesis protein